MKILKTIWRFFGWCLYALATQQERIRYTYGVKHGKHIEYMEKTYNVFGQLSGYNLYFAIPARPPEREYATWKQFWNQYNNAL